MADGRGADMVQVGTSDCVQGTLPAALYLVSVPNHGGGALPRKKEATVIVWQACGPEGDLR